MKRIYPHCNPHGYAFNAARLSEATVVFKKMIDNDATICLAMAGALTPAGLGGGIIDLIKCGLIDFIISTGANLYHDLHFALDLPVYKGDYLQDDCQLAKEDIVRIYDVFLPMNTLLQTDEYLQKNITLEGSHSTAEIHRHIGEKLLANAPKPQYSILATATEYDVPIYCPASCDSSIGMNIAYLYALNNSIHTDVEKDIIETTALIYSSNQSGGVILGGGIAKNFFMQTQPMLSQILHLPERGHNYFIQITADAPHWGGLSGATPQEAISWKKIDHNTRDYVTVYGDFSILAPLLFSKVLKKKRELKRLYLKRSTFVKHLFNSMGIQ